MKTVQIPNTELTVSRLAYGTARFGGGWDTISPTAEMNANGLRMIETAVEHGVNHIDMADIYGGGTAIAVMGHVLAQRPGLRDKLVLQGKCGVVLANTPNVDDPLRYDFSYAHIVASVEKMLTGLGTDSLDLLAFHRPDPLFEPEEVARAVDHLHSSGKVRHFGVSNHSVGQIALLQKHLDQPLVLNQLEVSLLHHHLISADILVNYTDNQYANVAGLLDYCRLHDIMIQAWSPVARGKVFALEEATAQQKAIAAELAAIAHAHGTTKAAVALAWILRHPAGIQPILGTMEPAHFPQSMPAVELELSRVEWYRLLAAGRGRGVL
ncbi:MAG: aldo/keto reductase [Chloroflexota bacterium]